METLLNDDELETWKEIDGLSGYWVSNFGQIKSKRKIRAFHPDRYGYLVINIKEKTYKVHQVVAKAFIPNPENLPEVNHKDGIKSHNWVDNLEWMTKSEQMKHAIATGLFNPAKYLEHVDRKGSKNGSAKLSEEKVEEIRTLLIEGNLSQRTIAKMFDISQPQVCHINTEKHWV